MTEKHAVILSFCATCKQPLPEDLGNTTNPTCETCGRSLKTRNDRIEGLFTIGEAGRMENTND